MKIKTPARDDAEVDMAPMIDLVFLLLIFFMVASVASTKKVPVDIPLSEHAKVPDNIQGRAIVSIDANGDYYWNLVPMKLPEIEEQIKQELEQNPNLRVVIRADRRVTFEYCKKLMIACGRVGANDLIYSAFEE